MIASRWPVVVLAALVACTGGGTPDASRESAPPETPVEAAVSEFEGVPPVTLVAPAEEGAGEVPTFAWEPVEEAAAYRLAVSGADGVTIWVWQGAETTVALGGLSVERPEGEAGPVITPGSSWSVAALSDDGGVIALSAERSVSP